MQRSCLDNWLHFVFAFCVSRASLLLQQLWCLSLVDFLVCHATEGGIPKALMLAALMTPSHYLKK
jgi:hypothetical protein